MTLSAVDAVVVFVLSTIGAGLGSYITAYLKKKGENLATHEDIQKLVEQVQATTSATENIRTAVTGNLWESQERWKMKSEMYLGLIKNLRFCIRYWREVQYAHENYHHGTRALDDEIARIERTMNDALRQARLNIDDSDAVATIINPRINGIVLTLKEDTSETDINFGESAREGAEAYERALESVVKESRADLHVGLTA